ncbi:GtrA family protein [uncultured Thiodictyon sp.]|uniref:GtrA family protein n=1 Tax=uncultured Thiodictyon sp. TaxID=1846217 RepID=UPI0025ED72E7|nr:GtrA family protein [uncultured Thiodictyon sp.]
MKIVRYFFVGATAAAVDIGLFGVAVKGLGLPWFPVAICSFVLATAVNYALSIRYICHSGIRFGRRHEVLLVFLVSAIGLVINQAVLWVLIQSTSTDVVLAKMASSACVFFWNYGVRGRFIFGVAESSSRSHAPASRRL